MLGTDEYRTIASSSKWAMGRLLKVSSDVECKGCWGSAHQWSDTNHKGGSTPSLEGAYKSGSIPSLERI